MNVESMRYTDTHAWMREEDEEWVLGITEYAAGQMGDIIFVELPEKGSMISAGDAYATVESAKAVEDLISPITGEVVRVNEELVDVPETINEDPYGEGWTVAVVPEEPPAPSVSMNADEYAAFLAELAEDD